MSFTLDKGDKMAVIGEEGDGKSTLLKAIYDLSLVSYALVEGKIIKKGFVSYLSQGLKQLDISVYDFLFLSLEDYYQKINDLYKYLLLIELSEDILEKNLTILSGGEKVKIQILKLLLENPEVLLLDEPTNDLDLKTIKWLESFINKIDIPVLYVSHDEELLENTANRILHIEQLNKKSEPKVTVVSLGYRQYVAERLHLIKRNITISNKEKKVLERQKDKLMEVTNSVEFYQNTISRSDPFTAASLKRKMKSLKVQERRLEKKEILEVPEYEEGIKLFFEEIKINPKKEIIDLKLDKLLIGKTELVSNLSLYVKGNEHIVIIGKNGVGKTTLLKNIYKTLLNKKELIIGYMPQDYQEIIDDDLT
ncbi:MAG: ATP-binding cassette domain-containing protein, partial [Bacillales bacterium]|nr:ATP-binding cassette domain-containing protein [Bacillales bacterium]